MLNGLSAFKTDWGRIQTLSAARCPIASPHSRKRKGHPHLFHTKKAYLSGVLAGDVVYSVAKLGCRILVRVVVASKPSLQVSNQTLLLMPANF